jgi:hypothetical protein
VEQGCKFTKYKKYRVGGGEEGFTTIEVSKQHGYLAYLLFIAVWNHPTQESWVPFPHSCLGFSFVLISCEDPPKFNHSFFCDGHL